MKKIGEQEEGFSVPFIFFIGEILAMIGIRWYVIDIVNDFVVQTYTASQVAGTGRRLLTGGVLPRHLAQNMISLSLSLSNILISANNGDLPLGLRGKRGRGAFFIYRRRLCLRGGNYR
jgi:hypothetical protein